METLSALRSTSSSSTPSKRTTTIGAASPSAQIIRRRTNLVVQVTQGTSTRSLDLLSLILSTIFHLKCSMRNQVRGKWKDKTSLITFHSLIRTLVSCRWSSMKAAPLLLLGPITLENSDLTESLLILATTQLSYLLTIGSLPLSTKLKSIGANATNSRPSKLS